MIISKINTEIETFCMDSDFRQSYPLIVFWGRGYDLDTQPCLFVPLFCLLSKTETIKKVLQYVDIVGLVLFLTLFVLGFQRRDRDSNPGNLSVQRFSRPPQSTTLPSFQYVLRSNVSFNCFAKIVILLEYTRVLCAFFLFVYSFLLRIECVGIPFLLLFL